MRHLDAMASEEEAVYRLDEARFRILGLNPTHREVVVFCNQLKWWTRFAGNVIRRGSARWSTGRIPITPEVAIEAWTSLWPARHEWNSAAGNFSSCASPRSIRCSKGWRNLEFRARDRRI